MVLMFPYKKRTGEQKVLVFPHPHLDQQSLSLQTNSEFF
jgi:hypothetical protein